eukprot:scaffold281_cov318-Pavlova_lutheri.AAC.9
MGTNRIESPIRKGTILGDPIQGTRESSHSPGSEGGREPKGAGEGTDLDPSRRGSTRRDGYQSVANPKKKRTTRASEREKSKG